MAHDPGRQLNFLVQTLTQDKRPISFFLGAGCPCSVPGAIAGSPLIPAIAGLTAKVAATIPAANKKGYEDVVAQLVADGVPSPNIEHVLTRVRGLSQIAGTGNARGLSKAELDGLDRAICEEIAGVIDCPLPKGDSGYLALATWILATSRTFPIEIFTTNYDLLLEQALERVKAPYFDGFLGSDVAFFDLHAMEEEKLPARWTRLWKVHGSLNWYSIDEQVVRTAKRLAGEKRVIHPSHLKYDESRKMPYLAMTDRLRAFLRQPAATLILSGYSFGDQHLNASIVDGLRSNPSATAFGLAYGKLSEIDTACRLAESRTNLSLFAKDGAVVGGKKALWAETTSAPSFTITGLKYELVAGKTPATHSAEFLLGDFRILGDLCREMVGLPAVP